MDDQNVEENQENLIWQNRDVVDATGKSRRFFFVETNCLRLNSGDARHSRPILSSKLCQLTFNIQVQVSFLTEYLLSFVTFFRFILQLPSMKFQTNLKLISDPFGICSHAQYFPEYATKVILGQLEKDFVISTFSNENFRRNLILENHSTNFFDRLTDIISRYHIRISGIPIQDATRSFIFAELKNAYGYLTLRNSIL